MGETLSPRKDAGSDEVAKTTVYNSRRQGRSQSPPLGPRQFTKVDLNSGSLKNNSDSPKNKSKNQNKTTTQSNKTTHLRFLTQDPNVVSQEAYGETLFKILLCKI